MFESLQDGLKSAFKSLRGKGKLTEGNMRDGLKLVEQSLLDADVSFSDTRPMKSLTTEMLTSASSSACSTSCRPSRIFASVSLPLPRSVFNADWRLS